jgi:hypothetical protein
MRRDPPESRVEPFERARIPVGTPAEARRIIDSLAGLELDHFKIRSAAGRTGADHASRRHHDHPQHRSGVHWPRVTGGD